MGKRKTQKGFHSTDIQLTGSTITEEFDNYLKTNRKVSDIIRFLSVKNAQLLSYGTMDPNEIPEDIKKQVIDFYEYFMDEYDDVTFNARMENWGQEPLIFRMAEVFEFMEEDKERKEFLDQITDIEKCEAESLSDTLMSIRKDKQISISYMDGCVEDLFIPGTIRKGELDDYRKEIFYYCALFIHTGGGMCVRCLGKQTEIFGIRTQLDSFKNVVWAPVSKELMLDADTLTSSGKRLEPEEGVLYTEIKRNGK